MTDNSKHKPRQKAPGGHMTETTKHAAPSGVGVDALVRRLPAPPTLRGDKTYQVSIAEIRRVIAKSEKYLPCGVDAASESAAEALILAMKEMGYAA